MRCCVCLLFVVHCLVLARAGMPGAPEMQDHVREFTDKANKAFELLEGAVIGVQDKEKVTLDELLCVSTQVVAGMNYAMRLRLIAAGTNAEDEEIICDVVMYEHWSNTNELTKKHCVPGESFHGDIHSCATI